MVRSLAAVGKRSVNRYHEQAKGIQGLVNRLALMKVSRNGRAKVDDVLTVVSNLPLSEKEKKEKSMED